MEMMLGIQGIKKDYGVIPSLSKRAKGHIQLTRGNNVELAVWGEHRGRSYEIWQDYSSNVKWYDEVEVQGFMMERNKRWDCKRTEL